MNAFGWIQLMLFVSLLVLITPLLGKYLMQVLDREGRPGWIR
jgi:K+-transporting ATPase A subunit